MNRFQLMIRLAVFVGWVALPCEVLAASITETSAAIGKDCVASGAYSTAMGHTTTAIGLASTAMGYLTRANQNFSTAMGSGTTASGEASTAIGLSTVAGGDQSFAGGRYMQLIDTAEHTFVWGYSDSGQEISAADAFLIFPAGSPGRVGVGTKNPKCLIDARNEKASFDRNDIADLQLLVANNAASVSGGKAAIGFSVSNVIDSNNIFGAMITHTPQGSYSYGGLEFWTKQTDTSTMNLTEKMRITKEGKVGIGTTAPNYKLEVIGDAAKTSGGTTWINSSDERLKDVTGEYGQGLNEIVRLRPITFHYKEDNPRGLPSDDENIGFIAQEVQEVFPEAVSEGPDGYLDFNMHPVSVALVNAVKELKAENEALKAENLAMKEDVARIKATLGM